MSEQMTWNEKLASLRAPLSEDEVEWRVQSEVRGGSSAMVLPYVTARAVQERFDRAFGPAGWQVLGEPIQVGPEHGISARIGVLAEGVEGPGWIWKGDVCPASDVEPMKGAWSGAMKRAAVQWGVGRELYDLPTTFVDLVDGRSRDPRAKYHRGKDRTDKHWFPPALHGGQGRPAPAPDRAPPQRQAPPPQPQQQRQAPPPQPAPAPAGEKPGLVDDAGTVMGIPIGVSCHDHNCVAPWPCPHHPPCPNCGGPMWDNREGKRNPKSPDFKCKDKACDAANNGGKRPSVWWTNEWAKRCEEAAACGEDDHRQQDAHDDYGAGPGPGSGWDDQGPPF